MITVEANGNQKFRLQVVPRDDSDAAAKIQAGSLKVTPIDPDSGADPVTVGANPLAIIETDDTFSVQADRPNADDQEAVVIRDFLIEGDADLGSGVETINEVVRLRVPTTRAKNLNTTALGAVSR